MFSYLMDVYYHQLRDLTGVNYGWVLRRFIAFFLVGLLIGIVATHAFSDIRSDFKTGSIEIWFDNTGQRKKVYNYADAEVTRWIEDNEHFSELRWDDGYCLKFSHYHKAGEKHNRQIPPPPTPASVLPTAEEQPTNQLTNQPIVVGEGGSPVADGTPTSHPVGPVATSAPQVVQPSTPLRQPLRVTEYMVRDWSGIPNLPQWIELYNPNTEAVNFKGWTFQYATRPFANHPYIIHTLTLANDTEDEFSIAGGRVAILATQAKLPARRFSGIQASQVYALGIPNELKSGWVLTDANGKEVYRIGKRAFSALRDPVAPPHQGSARVSHHTYRSEAPSEPHYYGYRHDIGSPGFYEQPAPSAPSAVRRKQVGTWARLKGEGP